MQQEENKLYCAKHPDSEYSVIFIGDSPSNQSRFLCVECVIGGGDQYKKNGLSQFVKIKDFFSDPYMQFRRTISDDPEAYIKETSKCMEQLSIFLKKFIENISSHLEQLKQNIKSLRILSATINIEIEKQSKFNDVNKLYQLIKNMDSFQGTNEFKRLQEDVNIICSRFPQLYKEQLSRLKDRYEQSSKDYKQSLLNIQKDLSQISAININSIQDINFFNIENQNDFSFLLKELYKFGNFQHKLIFKATRDGFSTDSYWQKCQNQSHLLTIITLKNGNIFGGYSPCQLILKENGYWAQDNTMQSFVFQQNKQEIYKLDKDNYYYAAIYCDSKYGPTFGGKVNFQVCNNFDSIASCSPSRYQDSIGWYQLDYRNKNLTGHNPSPIIECKVYVISILMLQ